MYLDDFGDYIVKGIDGAIVSCRSNCSSIVLSIHAWFDSLKFDFDEINEYI